MARRKTKREIPLCWANDPLSGVEVAVHSNARPTREALRQGDFAKGWHVEREVGAGYRRVDSLTRMAATGTITADHLKAGLRFRATFERARLHGLAAASFDPTPKSTDRARLSMGESIIVARERVARDIEWLGGHGSPLAEAAWWVVGYGHGIEEYARRARWANRALPAKSVTGLVIGALDLLDRRRLRPKS